MTYSEHITTDTLADHAEGLLGESEAGKVAAHLEGCADCRSTALMLASLSEILAADDPGPMPAQYVTRINATLAELAIAEPVIPGRAAAAPTAAPATAGGAQVIDLASRRKIMVTGLRRVGTVAAGVVLLITGAALGIQTLGNRSGPGIPDSASKAPPPVVDATIAADVLNIPADAVQNKQGNYVDPNTGTIYIPSSDKKVANKVLLPSGREIVKGSSGKPIVLTPVAPLAVPRNNPTAAPTTPAKSGHGHPGPVVPPTTNTPPPSATAPAATQASAAPNSGQAVGPTVVRPKGSQPADQRPHTTTVEPGRPEGDPYVTQSGSVYSEDNFAAKVMDLVSDADQHPGPNDNGRQAPTAGQPAPASAPVTDPAEPDAGPSDVTTTQTTTTSKHLGTRREVTADYTAPTAAMQPNAHGPASFDVEARVLRCAAQTHRQAIAGDDAFWGDRKATIVVVQSDNPNQVMGYVFYGECNQHGDTVTAQESPWEQQVDKPGTQPPAAQPSVTQPPATQSTTPPKRVGDVTSSQTQIKSSAPATTPPSGASSVTPDEQPS